MKTTTSTIVCLLFLIACIETDPSGGNQTISDRNNKAVTSFEVDKELENKILSKTDRESAERVLLKQKKPLMRILTMNLILLTTEEN